MRYGYLQISVGHEPTYEDNDIMSAVCSLQIRHQAAEGICRNGDLTLRRSWFEQTAKYKWERVNQTQVRRTNLWTLDQVVYGSEPIEDPDKPGSYIHCHVAEQFAFRQSNPTARFFPATNIEYGGGTKHDDAVLDAIWAEIEARTPHREADHLEAVFSDYRKRLVLRVDDFTPTIAGDLTSPLMEVTAKKRKHYVAWRSIPVASVIEADILNPRVTVRLDRSVTLDRATIVGEKEL